jgi:death-on-curing family protein
LLGEVYEDVGMARKRITVERLAEEAGVEVDEALLTLWDAGLGEVTGPGDFLARQEANRARRALGLATRRELGSPTYWIEVFSINADGLSSLLIDLGILEPYEGGRLRTKAINRLKAEARARGLSKREPSREDVRVAESESRPAHLVWERIGHEKQIRYLTSREVESIHVALALDLAEDPDPIAPLGVRDRSLLESAVYHPHTSIGEVSKYPTVEMAAAALFHAIVHNHAFRNGNKRTAVVALLVFLNENGLALTCDQDLLFKLVLQLAQHGLVSGPAFELADREVLAVSSWILENSRWIEKGDRPIAFRRLRRILSEYGCAFESPSGGGTRINILRTVERPRRFLKGPQSEVLHTQTYYGDEGREVEKNSIGRIRRDLELDEAHGVDSAAFYDSAKVSPSDFIARYRKLLDRLARL